FFELAYHPNFKAVLLKIEDRHHQFRHGIVLIEDYLGSKRFRQQCTEDENVRHVVYIDQVIPAPERAPGENGSGHEDERRILVCVGKLAPAMMGNGETQDVQATQVFTLRQAIITLANQVQLHSFFEERLGGAPRTGVGWIRREDHHAYPLSAEARSHRTSLISGIFRAGWGEISRYCWTAVTRTIGFRAHVPD